MKEIKKAMLAIMAVEYDDKLLRDFAMKEFNKKYPQRITNPIWFNGYEVIDENIIRVKYQYGGSDMELDGHFDVEI